MQIKLPRLEGYYLHIKKKQNQWNVEKLNETMQFKLMFSKNKADLKKNQEILWKFKLKSSSSKIRSEIELKEAMCK